MFRAFQIALLVAVIAIGGAIAAGPDYPPARRSSDADILHGIAVADPYRWLEDARSPESVTWLQAQERLLARIASADLERETIRRRLVSLSVATGRQAPIEAGGRYFLATTSAAGVLAAVCVEDDVKGPMRTLVESSNADRVRAFWPSPNGRWLAYAVSAGQSSWLTIRVRNVQTRADLPGMALQTHTAFGGVAWTADSQGFYFTRAARDPSRPKDTAPPVRPRLFFQGLPAQAPRMIFEPSGVARPILRYTATEDGRYLVLSVSDGSSPQDRVLYLDLHQPSAVPITLIGHADAPYQFLGSSGSVFWFYTTLDAPRGRVIAVDLTEPARGSWRTVVAESVDFVAGTSTVGGNALGVFGGRFVIMYLRDGRPRLRIFDTRGRLLHEPMLPDGGMVWGGLSGRQSGRDVYFQFLSLTDPATVYRLDVTTGSVTDVTRAPLGISAGRIIVEQVFYPARDGTRIPMFVAHRADAAIDGTHSAFMYGYGAFGWVSFIWYQPFVLHWIESGGVYAQPSIRGGGEYGERWHQAGARRLKQTGIDDYLAAAEWLLAHKYAAPGRLVANGGSASGALAAAAVLQRPDLFGAAVIDRPVLDLLRFDRFTQGTYWSPEFGSPTDPEDFSVLRRWSPYHNLVQGRCYPPTLVMSGDQDQVAVPLHAYKFTAALQAAQGCDHPVLLKIMHGAGHNFGNTPEETADAWADQAVFLRQVLPGSQPSSRE